MTWNNIADSVREDMEQMNETSTIKSIVIVSTDGIPPDKVNKAKFVVIMNTGKMHKYEAETLPFIFEQFINAVNKRKYGVAINLISPYIVNYKDAIGESVVEEGLGKTLATAAIAGSMLLGTPQATQAKQPAKQEQTIGIQNNNPINLKAFDKWDGMTGKDKYGHAIFSDLEHGIRASLKNLNNHKHKHPNQTLVQYLNTFAEANGTREAEYIGKQLGINPNIQLKDLDMSAALIALAHFESKINLDPKEVLRVATKYGLVESKLPEYLIEQIKKLPQSGNGKRLVTFKLKNGDIISRLEVSESYTVPSNINIGEIKEVQFCLKSPELKENIVSSGAISKSHDFPINIFWYDFVENKLYSEKYSEGLYHTKTKAYGEVKEKGSVVRGRLYKDGNKNNIILYPTDFKQFPMSQDNINDLVKQMEDETGLTVSYVVDEAGQSLVESKKSLKEAIDIEPKMLIMAGHNPSNVRYVWYYDEIAKNIKGSFKSGSHDDHVFADVSSKDRAIRGRVFEYNGKTFLIIYGMIAGFRNPNNEEIRDIYLKVSNEYKNNIDYVVGETGEDLTPLIESMTIEKAAEDIQDLINIQATDPVVKQGDDEGEYFRGLANGLIVAKACVDEKEPKFVNPDGKLEESHSHSKCMECDAVPTVEVKWAEGMGHAWFCDKCFAVWKTKDGKGEVNSVKKIIDGKASKDFADNKNPNINESISGYDYSSTQLEIPKEFAQDILKLTLSIPEEELYTERKEGKLDYGRETHPHITIKYGLETEDGNGIKELVKDIGPFGIVLGKLSIFSREDKPYDVVKAEIEGASELKKLNKLMSTLPNKDENPKYIPHLTIAYVKKGEGNKYIGREDLQGIEIGFDSFMFKGKEGQDKEIKLALPA